MNQLLRLDTETYSEIDLRKVGAHRYAYHKTTEVLILTYALNENSVVVVDLANGDSLPEEFVEAFENPDVLIEAHNSFFDRHIIAAVLGLVAPIERWRDTMVKGYSLGLPGSLEALGTVAATSADSQKMAEGKKLIQRFCKPAPKNHKADRYTRETHPEEWAKFLEYAAQDIVAMRDIDLNLPGWNYRGKLLEQWHLDQRINDRGLPIDIAYVRKAITLCDSEVLRLNQRLSDLTMEELTAHTQMAKMQEYLKKHFKLRLPNMQAGTLDAIVETDIPDLAKEIINIRREAGKSSVSKYTKLGVCTSPDGRLHGGLQYAGAPRTMRWAGRLFQPQNLPRPVYGLDQLQAAAAIEQEMVEILYDNPMSIASSCIRGAVCAPKGKTFYVSDLSNIEGRLAAWIAGEEWKVQVFRDYDAGTGPDVYKKTYAEAMRKPIEKVNKDDRQVGKVIELACAYQGWLGAFDTFSAMYNISIPEDEAKHIILGWRAAHPKIVNMWESLEVAFIEAMQTTRTDVAFKAGPHIQIKKVGNFVLIHLPSGRFIPYYRPHKTYDAQRRKHGIRFKSVDDRGRFVEIDTYGGKLFENVCQAVARDIMAENMLTIDETFPIVCTVHDEVICEADEGLDVRTLDRMLANNHDWCKDLPLAAGGYTSKRYKKDD